MVFLYVSVNIGRSNWFQNEVLHNNVFDLKTGTKSIVDFEMGANVARRSSSKKLANTNVTARSSCFSRTKSENVYALFVCTKSVTLCTRPQGETQRDIS